MLQISQNIARIRKLKGKTQEQVAKELGIKRSTYSNWEKTIVPGIDDIRRIAKILDTPLSDFIDDQSIGMVVKQIAGQVSEPVPVYDVGSRAGIITIYQDDQNTGPIAQLSQELFPGCNHAEIVRGDSMHPVIRNGGVAVGKKFEKTRIISGDIYLIHTINELRTVKYVHELSDGNVLLKSHNKIIPDQTISVNEISMICRKVLGNGVLSNRFMIFCVCWWRDGVT